VGHDRDVPQIIASGEGWSTFRHGGQSSGGHDRRTGVQFGILGIRMVTLDVFATAQEAELVSGLLASAGIESVVRQTNLGAGASDGLSIVGPYEVVVEERDLETAREVLASQARTFDVDDG